MFCNLPTRSIFNVVMKAITLLAFFFVGYMYGITNNYKEIIDNQHKIAWLEEKTLNQQIEIDKLKEQAIETSSIKKTIDNLSQRISDLEFIIKSQDKK